MQINELKVKPKKKRKTIGRGGKRGTYCGKGNKGQKARSGAHVDPLFEGGRSTLTERLKKIRGFKSTHPKKINFDLNDLEINFKENDTISIESLIKVGLIDKIESRRGVKILGDGKLTKKFVIDEKIMLSKSAAEAIRKLAK